MGVISFGVKKYPNSKFLIVNNLSLLIFERCLKFQESNISILLRVQNATWSASNIFGSGTILAFTYSNAKFWISPLFSISITLMSYAFIDDIAEHPRRFENDMEPR